VSPPGINDGDAGIVVIGRNEGERLLLCLKSVLSCRVPVVYVDSGSSDGSASAARNLDVEVVELDTSRPVSAARARNEGFQRLISVAPCTRFVQFVDGDCTLADGWLNAGVATLMSDPTRAAVVGHLLERRANATPYNRLCQMEWRSVPGTLASMGAFGGISLMRVSIFRELGGFNPSVIAGEDSEFGVRMRLAGYTILKIDSVMATHDANITKFRQWWIRSVRSGHAIGQRAHIHGMSPLRDCVRERNSTWFWGVGVPALVIVTLVPTSGASLVFLAGYVALAYRMARYRIRQGDSLDDALLYTRFGVLAKFAEAIGLARFHLNRLARRYHIIEYK
jgi:GT2 family glycosyltransferase